MRTVFDLMLATAKHLLQGEGCLITYNVPQDKRLLGHAQRNLKGQPIININPNMTGNVDQDLRVFLHEVAHHRFTRYKPSQVEDRPTLPDKGKGYRREVYQRDEDKADTLAKHWLSYGRRHADPNLPEFEGVLTALLQYPN